MGVNLKIHKYIDPEQFYIARRRAGLTINQAAEKLDVDIKTLRNWENGKTKIPYAAFKMMRLYGGYGLINDGWQGWAIWEGKLFSPTGRSFEPHELTYLSNYISMARMFIKDRLTVAEASRAQAPFDASAPHQNANIQRGKAGGANAPSGVRPCHDTSIVSIVSGQYKVKVNSASNMQPINFNRNCEPANEAYYERKGA